MHSFKFEAVFDAPVEHMLALAREFDLTSSWNKYTLDSTILHEESIFETLVYAAAWMPPPFPQADSVLQARGLDLAEVSRNLCSAAVAGGQLQDDGNFLCTSSWAACGMSSALSAVKCLVCSCR